jgi:hypothetical protein
MTTPSKRAFLRGAAAVALALPAGAVTAARRRSKSGMNSTLRLIACGPE